MIASTIRPLTPAAEALRARKIASFEAWKADGAQRSLVGDIGQVPFSYYATLHVYSKRALVLYRWVFWSCTIQGHTTSGYRLEERGYLAIRKNGSQGRIRSEHDYSELLDVYAEWVKAGKPDEFECVGN
jgi:hypothetical protein